jgi:hypothetical protein
MTLGCHECPDITQSRRFRREQCTNGSAIIILLWRSTIRAMYQQNLLRKRYCGRWPTAKVVATAQPIQLPQSRIPELFVFDEHDVGGECKLATSKRAGTHAQVPSTQALTQKSSQETNVVGQQSKINIAHCRRYQ